MDAYQCISTYDIGDNFEAIELIFEEYPDFSWNDKDPDEGDDPNTLYYTWLRLGESKKFEERMHPSFRHASTEDGVGTLGNIKFSFDTLEVETFSKQKFEFAKEMIDYTLGDLVTIKQEKIVDLAKQIAQKIEKGIDLTPKKKTQTIQPEVEKIAIKQIHEKNYSDFMDRPIPMLDNISPRGASKRPELCHKLIELMKKLSGLDTLKKEKDIIIDIDWMLDELGLSELK